MSIYPRVLLHHSESVDPTLVDWIQDKIDDLFGLEPEAIVLLIGLMIMMFPIGLLGFMWWQRRKSSKAAE